MDQVSFEKTVADLLECYKHMQDKLSDPEEAARRKLIRLCKQISEEFRES